MKNHEKPDLDLLFSHKIKKKQHIFPSSLPAAHTTPLIILENLSEKPVLKSANIPSEENIDFCLYHSEARKTPSLANLISNPKRNNEEIDLFEDELHGFSSEPYNSCDYWRTEFLKNNIGDKNIMVIPIEDDETTETDQGLWRFAYKDIEKWNKRKAGMKSNHHINNQKRNGSYVNSGDGFEGEKEIRERVKWVNCFLVKFPREKEEGQKNGKKARVIGID